MAGSRHETTWAADRIVIFPLIFLMKNLDVSPQTRFHFSDILISDILLALNFP